MTLKDALIKKIDTMNDDQLAWLLQVAEDLQEPDEEEPTSNDIKALAKAKDEYEQGECISWSEMKKRLGKA